MPIVVLIALIFTILGSVTAYAAGNVYYVAKNGSNSNPGTQSQPWLTIQNAVNKMVSGDTVYVEAGTYSEAITISGKSNITLMAYPGTTPVISCAGVTLGNWKGIITITGTSAITINGFEIAHTSAVSPYYGYGIYAASTSINHLTLKNLHIHDICQGGLFIAYATNVVIDSCEIYDTNRIIDSNELLSLYKVNGAEVMNSMFYDPGKNPINAGETVPVSRFMVRIVVTLKMVVATLVFIIMKSFLPVLTPGVLIKYLMPGKRCILMERV